jgi:type IX secretion system PorP/SprF family membrane protein
MHKRSTFLLLSFLILTSSFTIAQQLPYYTQFMGNLIALNPAVAGTKRLLDIRLDYRKQWVGFEGAPTTQFANINSRLAKGTMGLGLSFLKDQTGPSQRSAYSGAYSFHIRYPDLELSLGLAGSYYTYTLNGNYMSIHDTHDLAVIRSELLKTNFFDASIGMLMYNDRFHFGLSLINIIQSTAKLNEKLEDTTRISKIKMIPNFNMSLSYNFYGGQNLVWENALLATYVFATPFVLEYMVRLHYKETAFAGIALRLQDVIALQVGCTIWKDCRLSYSYDFDFSKLRTFHGNTHEIMLIYSTNFGQGTQGRNQSGFKKQKYGYMF